MAPQYGYDSTAQLRRKLTGAVPHLANVEEVPENEWAALPAAKLGGASFAPAVRDFYLSNPIARASQLMAELSALAAARRAEPMAAE